MTQYEHGLDREALTLHQMIEDGALGEQDFIQETAGNAKGEAELAR